MDSKGSNSSINQCHPINKTEVKIGISILSSLDSLESCSGHYISTLFKKKWDPVCKPKYVQPLNKQSDKSEEIE